MKSIVYIFPLFFVLILSCKKETSGEEQSKVLEVEERNRGVVAKRTATWCGPCGGFGWNTFDNHKNTFGDDAVYLAFKTAFNATSGGLVSPMGNELYNKVFDIFDLESGTPRFFFNFNKDAGSSVQAINQHVESPVYVNSNYEMLVQSDKILLETTVKFFRDTVGEFVIVPFLILDDIEGPQSGHANSPNVPHPKFVADIARPITLEQNSDWGYTFITGEVKAGLIMNLTFEVERKATWGEENISFTILIFKKEGTQYKFINAFSKS